MKKINKAILLAGGLGTRLSPMTQIYNKHLLPINDKFIIDYPIRTLKNMGVEHLTVVLGGAHFQQIVSYLKDGKDLGLEINYVYQGAASGIAQAINLCKSYVDKEDSFCVHLGDNIYERDILWGQSNKAQIVLHRHPDLHRFGVATIDDHGAIIKVEEKPKILDEDFDNLAITGCYLFNGQYFDYFKHLTPSLRGEYEITHIIERYLADNDLDYYIADRLWNDAGTFESIRYVSDYFNRLKNDV